MRRAISFVSTLLLLAGVVTTDAGAQSPPTKKPPAPAAPSSPAPHPVPAPEVLLMLVRTALIALDQANKTADYTVLREFGGPALKGVSASQLSDMFSAYRANGVDLSPVAVTTPTLTETPAVTPQGLLRLAGFFPTQPLQVHFQILFQNVNGAWRPAALSVTMVAPQAPRAQ